VIGSRSGIGESGVSHSSRLFLERPSGDRELKKVTKLVKKQLGMCSLRWPIDMLPRCHIIVLYMATTGNAPEKEIKK